MKKIICIGSACKDLFFPTHEGERIETPEDLTSKVKIVFELGAKYKIEERFESLGGCAANVACGLARRGIDASCYSKVGDDITGNWIIEELKKNGVDVGLVERENGFSSDLSSIIVDEKSGDRIIFSNQKVNGTLRLEEEKMNGAEWFFIGDLHGEWEKHLDFIFEVARKGDIKVAFNPRQSNIHDNAEKIISMIAGAQVLFMNKDEAIEIIQTMDKNIEKENLNNEEFLIRKIKGIGAGLVALTDGNRGAWGYDGNNFYYVEAQQIKAIDSTGAGDAFASGFLASYFKGNDLKECLYQGVVNGGNVVQHYGGVEGLLPNEK